MITVAQIKALVAERIRSCAFFDGVDVFTDESPDIRGAIDRMMRENAAGNDGAAVFMVVTVPQITDGAPGAFAGMLVHKLAVQAYENPYANRQPGSGRTIKTADELCRNAFQQLKSFCVREQFRLAGDPQAIVAIQSKWAPYAMQAGFDAIELDTQEIKKLDAPVITIATGTCTITADSDCDVYYTLDGSSYPRATVGTLYAGPFAVSSGQVVMAAAYYDDATALWLQSDVARETA
jgi:hypothetical protein